MYELIGRDANRNRTDFVVDGLAYVAGLVAVYVEIWENLSKSAQTAFDGARGFRWFVMRVSCAHQSRCCGLVSGSPFVVSLSGRFSLLFR
jgi:hypothetical protein